MDIVVIVVTHPASATYRRAAATRPGSADRTAEGRKRLDHEGGAEQRFVPFSIGTYGRLGEGSMDLLKVWADGAATGGSVKWDAFLVWMNVICLWLL